MTDPAPYLPDGRAAEHVRRALGITRPCPANLCALPLTCAHRGIACADEPQPDTPSDQDPTTP